MKQQHKDIIQIIPSDGRMVCKWEWKAKEGKEKSSMLLEIVSYALVQYGSKKDGWKQIIPMVINENSRICSLADINDVHGDIYNNTFTIIPRKQGGNK
jgi:hypothetical protein